MLIRGEILDKLLPLGRGLLGVQQKLDLGVIYGMPAFVRDNVGGPHRHASVTDLCQGHLLPPDLREAREVAGGHVLVVVVMVVWGEVAGALCDVHVGSYGRNGSQVNGGGVGGYHALLCSWHGFRLGHHRAALLAVGEVDIKELRLKNRPLVFEAGNNKKKLNFTSYPVTVKPV